MWVANILRRQAWRGSPIPCLSQRTHPRGTAKPNVCKRGEHKGPGNNCGKGTSSLDGLGVSRGKLAMAIKAGTSPAGRNSRPDCIGRVAKCMNRKASQSRGCRLTWTYFASLPTASNRQATISSLFETPVSERTPRRSNCGRELSGPLFNGPPNGVIDHQNPVDRRSRRAGRRRWLIPPSKGIRPFHQPRRARRTPRLRRHLRPSQEIR